MLTQTPSLMLTIDTFVHNTGATSTLLMIQGTIPIFFKANQYNIPVAFYLPEPFPTVAPLCYVKPVAGMLIKPRHLHVDTQGQIYLPYLRHWQPQSSTLVDLIAILSSVFSDDPPVYSALESQPPPPPGPAPVSSSNAASARGSFHAPNSAVDSSASNTYSFQPYHHQSASVSSSSSLTSSSSPISLALPGTYAQLSSQIASSSISSSLYSSSGLPAPASSSSHQSSSSASSSSFSIASSLNPIHDAVLRKVSDKVNTAFTQIHQEKSKRLDQLTNQQNQLKKSTQQYVQAFQELKAYRDALQRQSEQITEQSNQIQTWMAQNSARLDQPLDVDSLVMPQDALAQQILDLNAEDLAIDDALDILSKALKDEIINFDQFVKSTRKLANQQFLVRSLAMKAENKYRELQLSSQ